MKLALTGHKDGHTEVIFGPENDPITCGQDGSIKLWKGTDFDDSPTTIKCGEVVNSIALNDETIYAACNNNRVYKYSTQTKECEGLLMQFDGNPTHVHVSENKDMVAAGSNNFDVKAFFVNSGDMKFLKGHTAPVLSVAVDPVGKYVASVGCDGDLKIWDAEKSNCVKSIKVLPPTNDLVNSASLARLSWQPVTGDEIAIPCESEIRLYTRDNWMLSHKYKCDKTTKVFNGCSYSPCMRYLAAYTVDGWICVWDTETHELIKTWQHPQQTCVSSLAWDSDSSVLAIADTTGQMGIINDIFPQKQNKDSFRDDLDALFENEDGEMDDGMLLDAEAKEDKKNETDADDLPDIASSRRRPVGLFDDSDDDDKPGNPSSQTSDFAIPSTNALLMDNNSLDPPILPPENTDLLDDAASVLSQSEQRTSSDHRMTIAPTIMQKSFQPSATPEHLSHRFMLWNSVGVIRSYADEIENAIDVEFHDSSLHHTIHVRNEAPSGGAMYTMADLSSSALALAALSSSDNCSKLTCNYFASWDNSKEWTIEMNDGEDIRAVAVGESWVAVCTDLRMTRMYTLGGMQRHIFSIPGPVVAMAAHTDQLMIVYHISQGFNNNQNLGVMLLEVDMTMGGRPRNVINDTPLPMSKKSILQWVGFSAEGTPVFMDSSGILRMLNRGFAHTWMPIAETRENLKSRHDNYWVLGVHENPQQLRCVLCKGSLHPQTLPRPIPVILPFNIPFCEKDSEKTKFEEDYWRSNLLSSHMKYLESHGFETDNEFKKKSALDMQQTLMKMFALSCKTDRDFRATEICNLMTNASAVNLAIKYAARLRKIVLAQKLGEIAKAKTEHELDMLSRTMDEDEEQEDARKDFRSELQAGYSKADTEWSTHQTSKHDEDDMIPSQGSLLLTQEEDVPSTSSSRFSQRSSLPSTALTAKNPFKRTPVNLKKKGSSVLDGMTRTASASKLRGVISSKEKKMTAVKDNNMKQKTIFDNFSRTSTPKVKNAVSRIKSEVEESEIANPEVIKAPRAGVQVYIEDKLEEMKQEHPEMDAMEIRKMIITQFRNLTPHQKQEWNDRGRNSTTTTTTTSAATTTSTKRKLSDEATDGDFGDENLPDIGDEFVSNAPSSKLRKVDDEIKQPLNNANHKLQLFAYDD